MTGAGLHEWCKQVAPSTALRTWYSHDPQRFAEFRRRYQAEADREQRPDHQRGCSPHRTTPGTTTAIEQLMCRPGHGVDVCPSCGVLFLSGG
ncbi:MAG: DUF488 domain-containing protein [Pseudonocardiaceae bacterium]